MGLKKLVKKVKKVAKKVAPIAAPIVGGALGGPVGAGIGGAIGGAASGGGLKGAAIGGALGYGGATLVNSLSGAGTALPAGGGSSGDALNDFWSSQGVGGGNAGGNVGGNQFAQALGPTYDSVITPDAAPDWGLPAGGSELSSDAANWLGAGGSLPTDMSGVGLAGGQFTVPGYGPDVSGGNIFGAGGLGAAGGALPSIMDSAPGTGVGANAFNWKDALNTSSAAANLSRLLREKTGMDIDPRTLGMIGTGLVPGLGVYGANQQNKALQNVINQQQAVTTPFLNDAMDMFQNPNKFYERPEVTGAIDASLRGLSSKVGNPINNPGAIAQQAAYNTGLYNTALNTRLATALGGQDTLNRLQTQQALQKGNSLNALGSGLGSMLATQPNYSNVLGEYLSRIM